MNELRGWLLDVYPAAQEGAVFWLLGEDGIRHRLSRPFAVTFYAAGPAERLRTAWRYLEQQPVQVRLARVERRDLFQGLLTVLSITVQQAIEQPQLLRNLVRCFPDLDYYDADIPLPLRCAAAWGAFPLARCLVRLEQDNLVQQVCPLDSGWDLDFDPPPLRVLAVEPDCNPSHVPPSVVYLRCERASYCLPLQNERLLLINLEAILHRHDPDLLLIHWGDTWLLPRLLDLCAKHNLALSLNRDPGQEALRRKENSYFTYGQVVYRGQQVHLYGRWHVDAHNAMMFKEYGLEGIFEQARVTGLPVQTVARSSPGAGITALQIITALRQGILTPYQKQQAERFKSLQDLIRADRGGLVYQPLAGLHRDVAEIDFVSMYPALMVHFNLSPETVGKRSAYSEILPASTMLVDRSAWGFVPQTLAPLLSKRIALKERLDALDRRDCRYHAYKARTAALKWLLVVCFGYLGYKNARFGRIESHEAVTACGREILLQAKEAAEALGFTVLHLNVDSLFVHKAGCNRERDYQPLLTEVVRRTGLAAALDGIYRWIAFPSSCMDERLSVANRYFGVLQDGSLKTRGIAGRRSDTPPFIAAVQSEMLETLAGAPDADGLAERLPEVLAQLRQRLAQLRSRYVPLEQLLVRQKVSRQLHEYRSPSAAARAAAQLQMSGKVIRPGQWVPFVYTLGDPGVWAWDCLEAPNPQAVDTRRYTELLLRAAAAILQPLGIGEQALRWQALYQATPINMLLDASRMWLAAGCVFEHQQPGFGLQNRGIIPGVMSGKGSNKELGQG